MRDIQIGVIGGGSVFTPELVDLLIRQSIPVKNLILMDIATERVDIVARMARRQAARLGKPLTVSTTDQYRVAIEGSDFLLIQLRAGGNRMRIEDEAIALRHEIPFVETVSVPGLGAFLRSAAVYDEIANLAHKYAPAARIMNFTNPAGALTQYLQALGLDAVGICNSPPGFVAGVASILDLQPEAIAMDWKGLNHLTFVTTLTAGDRRDNLLPRLLKEVTPGSPEVPFSKMVLQDLGLGINTYLQYYFHARRKLRELHSQSESRGQQVAKVNRDLLALYNREETVEVPDLLKKRGGFGYSKVVVDLMQSLMSDDHRLHYVNVRNGTTIPGLPADTVVEVPAVAVNGTVQALSTGELPEVVLPLVLTMATVYRYWVRAASHRSLADLRRSMLVHPLFPDAEESEAILRELLEASREFVGPYA